MQKIIVTENGTFDIPVPEWATYSILYTPANLAGTATLKAFGTPLEDGVLVASKQYKIDHGREVSMDIEISGFTTEYSIDITFGD